jgi:formamidopyrimidine-DNA glycosylase
MPELPEVETIARSLREGREGFPALPGQVISHATVRWPRHVAQPSLSTFRRRIRGQQIENVMRRGKYLVLPLSADILLIHLKMSGDLILAPTGSPSGRFDRTVFHLRSGWELRFSDARKFGKVFLSRDPSPRLGSLGPEPLETSLSANLLAERLAGHRRPVKLMLLDQSVIAGLGNIYADEALHRACVHPATPSTRLGTEDAHRLLEGIREALREGIRRNGASIDWVYRGGDYQNYFRVYQRTGLPCPVCTTPIARIVLGQRGTHFCPTCQPEPGVS